MKRPTGPILFSFLLAAVAPCVLADDWPTLHHDVQRTGYTKDSPSPPFSPMPKYHWVRFFTDEQIACYVEAIVADGKVFVGTYAGNMYALNRETGATVWKFRADDVIRHSPAYDKGRLYFGSQDGKIYCLDAKTGKERWTYQTGAGVWTSPAVSHGLVMMGSRDLDFYALDAKTGKLKWKLSTGAPILNSAAVAGEAVIFASEDGFAYCARCSDGKLLWKADLGNPLSVRGYYPTIWNRKAVIPTAIWNGKYAGNIGPGYRSQDIDFVADLAGAGRIKGQQARAPVPITEEAVAREAKAAIPRVNERHNFFTGRKPSGKVPKELTYMRKIVHCLDLDSGKETTTLPMLYETGNYGLHGGPAVGPDGALYITNVSFFCRWPEVRGGFHKSVYPYGIVRVDPKTFKQTPVNGKRVGKPWGTWKGPTLEWEEHYTLTVGGPRLYVSHSDMGFGMRVPEPDEIFFIGGARDTYAGLYGHIHPRAKPCPGPWPPLAKELGVPLVLQHEMHGPGRGGLSISGKDLFWIAGGIVICVRGR